MDRAVRVVLRTVIGGLAVAAYASAGCAQDMSAVPPPLGKLVDIGGRRLHLHCTGSGSPTVIVENGSSGYSMEWALVQPKVAAFTRICTYDRAGMAWSDRGPAENTVAETMDDLHLLLRTASIAPPYVMVGQSIGGMYIRAYQRRFPADVAGLVLVDATPEEDLEYMSNGKNTAGVFLSFDELAAVYAPYIKNPPPKLDPPTKVEEPDDRLPPDLQRAALWADRQFRSRIDMSHSWFTAESWREEFVELRNRRLASAHSLGDLPLIVLRRGLRTNDVLNEREADLARLSSAGKLIVATNSDHDIHMYQPELVASAIHDIVNAARKRRK